MEPLTVAAATALTMKYVLPAISGLGRSVLESTENAVADEVVSFGKRLLSLLLRRRDSASAVDVSILQGGIERRVRTLADDPGQDKASAQLEGSIEELLIADPGLFAELRMLLASAPQPSVSLGDGSIYIGRDNRGTVVSGNSNIIFDPSRRD